MRKLSKLLLTYVVDLWARIARFSFPEKYTWRWKLDMLASRYEPETTRLCKEAIAPGAVVADVGAHIGYFTRLFSSLAGSSGRVFAFEADADNFELLKSNTERRRNVVLTRAAVSSVEGSVPFYHVAGSTGCHTTVAGGAAGASPVDVPALTLDAFFEQQRVRNVDFVKMDIEGGEWEALRGMDKLLGQERLALVIEWKPEALQHGGRNAEALLSFLIERGFSLAVITGSGVVRIEPDSLTRAREYLDGTGSTNVYATKG